MPSDQHTTTKTSNNKTWCSDLLLLALLLSALFGAFLGSRPLNVPDEGRYAEIPREMVASGDYVTPHLNEIKYFEKPPLVYWLQAGAIKTLGLSEWALRLPTALLALLGCLVTYSATRLLYNRQSAWLAALIQSTSLFYFAMAHLITLDMSVTFFLSTGLLAFIVGVQQPTSKARRICMWLLFASAALAVLTKGLIGIIFPGMIIGAWMLLLNEWRELKTLYLPSSIILFALIAVPWHVLVQSANPEFFSFYFIEQQFARYLTLVAGRYQPDWFFLPILLIGFFPWILFLPQAIKAHWPSTWKTRKQYKTELFLLIWAGFIFIFFSLSKSKLIPYILPMFPAISILTGHYLSTVWHQPKRTAVSVGFYLLPPLAALTSLALLKIDLQQTADPLLSRNYLLALAGFLIIGSLLTLYIYRRWQLPRAFIALVLVAPLYLITILGTANVIDTRSVKSFAVALKPLLRPGDDVVVYGNYYQDLPFYLQRRVTIVGWTNELSFGMRHQNKHDWMISYDTFWQRWPGKQRLFLVVDRERWENLTRQKHILFYPVAETTDNLLLSNKPIKTQP